MKYHFITIEGNIGAGAVLWSVQLPLGHFGTLLPEVTFCAESGKASKQIKTHRSLFCITASISFDAELRRWVAVKCARPEGLGVAIHQQLAIDFSVSEC